MATCAGLIAFEPRLARPLHDLMLPVIEPAVEHVAGRECDRPDSKIELPRRGRDHLVAIEAGTALGEDRAHRLIGPHAEIGARARELDGGAYLRDVAGKSPRPGAQLR